MLGRINSLQRQYVVMAQNPYGLPELWRWKRDKLPTCPMPNGFPWKIQLERAGYRGIEDLFGATAIEISNVSCLSESEGHDVLHALFGTRGVKMGYIGQDGKYYDVWPVEILVEIERTESGESGVIQLDDRNTLRLNFDVLALSADATIDVELFTRRDVDDVWRSIGSFAQASIVGVVRRCFVGLDRQAKAVFTLSTSGTATFSLIGEAS